MLRLEFLVARLLYSMIKGENWYNLSKYRIHRLDVEKKPFDDGGDEILYFPSYN